MKEQITKKQWVIIAASLVIISVVAIHDIAKFFMA